jgi:hypothetical protein
VPLIKISMRRPTPGGRWNPHAPELLSGRTVGYRAGSISRGLTRKICTAPWPSCTAVTTPTRSTARGVAPVLRELTAQTGGADRLLAGTAHGVMTPTSRRLCVFLLPSFSSLAS